MIPLFLGTNVPAAATMGYQTEAVREDFSRHTAGPFSSRRLSRGSTGQRSGAAMRVVKPSSANNSPRASMLLSRRRTMMSDGMQALVRQQLIGQGLLPTAATSEYAVEAFPEPTKSAPRPLSWHPSSQHHQLQQYFQMQQAQSQYATASPFAYSDLDAYTPFPHMSPVPTAYSGQTSPSPALSPISLPLSGYDATQCLPINAWGIPMQQQQQPPALSYSVPSEGAAEPFPSLPASVMPAPPSLVLQAQQTLDWAAFAAHGFDGGCTAPPTPDTFPPAQQQPEPAVTLDEHIPFEPLEESEEAEGGEILIGMGLYDPPDKTGTDPSLDNYRTTTSHLLGTAHVSHEPTGKGLKLEEEWEPPSSDDDDDDDEDEEQEADGEDDAEGEEQDS